MRTITSLVLVGVLALAACSTATAPSQSASPTAGRSVAVTPTASPVATPRPTATATPVETVEPTPSPAILTIDSAAGEAMLLSGLRQDLRDACAPIGTGLPPEAVAGVRCDPTSKIVDRVTLYLFRSQAELLDAYGAWLAAHKIPPRTNGGRCEVRKASEGGYVPGDDHGIVVAERGGCFVDADGKAHYGATMPPFVLAEVDGKVGDISAVEAWAWRGNQDQPGTPTVWRSNDQ